MPELLVNMGGLRRWISLLANGSCGESHGAAIAATTTISRMMTLIVAALLRSNRDSNWRFFWRAMTGGAGDALGSVAMSLPGGVSSRVMSQIQCADRSRNRPGR